MPSKGTVNNPTGIGGFKEGQSGNPGGRAKRKPLTDAILRQLDANDGAGYEELAANIIAQAKKGGKTSIDAFRTIAAYVDGLPTQTIGFDPDSKPAVFVLPSNGREERIDDENSLREMGIDLPDNTSGFALPPVEEPNEEL